MASDQPPVVPDSKPLRKTTKVWALSAHRQQAEEQGGKELSVHPTP
jgi:hypothetical protein